MLTKLLKYDIKAQIKSLIPLYIIALALPIAIRILSLLNEQFPVLSTFLGLAIFAYVIILIGVVLWTMIVSIKHFYNTMLKDEGYLTNTLPVSRHNIILSKELTSIITLFLSCIMIAISLTIFLIDGDLLRILKDISIQLSYVGIDSVKFIVYFIILMILSYISQMQMFYLSMMLGQTRNTNKVLFSIVFAIIIYIILQIVSLGVMYIDTLIAPDIMQVMSETNPAFGDVYNYVLLIFVSTGITTIVSMLIFHFGSVALANKKLNLE